jgi:DNA-binding NtrC family response regulator
MIDLDILQKVLKIEIVEDDRSTAKLLSKKLQRHIEGCKIINRDRPEYLFSDLPFERPTVIVLDWRFPGYSSVHLIPRLSKYKGLVCIFSNEEVRTIQNEIIDHLGELPTNIKIYNKHNYRGLENEISSYIADNY